MDSYRNLQRNPYLEIWDLDYYSTSDEEDDDDEYGDEKSEEDSADSEVDE